MFIHIYYINFINNFIFYKKCYLKHRKNDLEKKLHFSNIFLLIFKIMCEVHLNYKLFYKSYRN